MQKREDISDAVNDILKNLIHGLYDGWCQNLSLDKIILRMEIEHVLLTNFWKT